ncbi:neuronal tyrosine-phosphorylated phosphoinositide-3-kinase adapter 2-like [Hippocampus zosterae]|uniref:neuronal tyrosine-phosphorylated phosphoinositide-3-kinase adapter 2-like n=1 Tax=Hippocampus zosterae TaxID=109293 RepID=UPI00223E502A|nr:neuronal tyrosine-phosphorylated phosphoinositide-3-kinase adapter 2-like [Hippocampus zosterae]
MASADLPPAPGQSLDSMGGADEERKRPPPKPRRDPGTKLGGSTEALHEGQSHPCGEDRRRTPPPKPKRNPDTQLSSSLDEPESVYVEMAANAAAAEGGADPDESVYEEMKYWDRRPPPRHTPQPFPKLLTHRPPPPPSPLVFPPARSPNSDESPLTPVDVARLSVAGKKVKRGEDQEEAGNTAPSGRSSAPLPCGPWAEPDDASPRSRSACPSPVGAARSRTPLRLKGPPPYDALMARRSAATGPRRGAEEFKRCHPLGRSSSASGAPGSPRDHPALSQLPWLCRDVTMMETIEKKRVLCGEIRSRRQAALPAGVSKQPPPYPAAILWDTAI